MTAKIPLQNGEYAIIDKEDYERCMEYLWFAAKQGNSIKVLTNTSEGVLYLSRFVSNAEKGKEIVHRNGNTLDHRKGNLMSVDRKYIAQSRRGKKNSSSIYKGVSYDKKRKRWKARIRQRHLGWFEKEEDAALAYNAAAVEEYGENAYLNKIGINNNAFEVKFEKAKQRRTIRTTGYKGVRKEGHTYSAIITIKGKHEYLGSFNTKIQAAKAYDKKAYELYGDKAILNFPELIDEYKSEVTTNVN